MFNLTSTQSTEIRQEAVYSLVIYDIRENKRRVELAKMLEGYGQRVQHSCFEVKTTRVIYQKLLNEIESFYCLDCGDNIIIYHISKNKVYRYNSELVRFDDDLIFL